MADRISSIFTVQKMYMALNIFTFALLLPYYRQFLSHQALLSSYIVYVFVPLLLIPFFRRLRTKQFMVLGILLMYASVFVYFVEPTVALLYFQSALSGCVIFFFWACYNVRYFTFSNKMNRATTAGYFAIVSPVLNLFLPLISVFVIDNFGYKVLVAVSFFGLVFLLRKASHIPDLDVDFSFFRDLPKARGMRTLKFLQGVWESGYMAIGLFTLLFVSSNLSFAGFLSFLGLVGVLATVFVTRFSDKQHKRMKFFFPLLLLLIVFTTYLSLADNFVQWVLFASLVNVVATLVFPFFYSVVLDRIDDLFTGLVIREFFLNAGRLAGFVGMVLMGYFGIPHPFLVPALGLIVYMTTLFWRGVYVEEAYYPLSPVVKMYDGSKNLVLKVYAWGKVEKLAETPIIMTTTLFTGVRWMTVSAAKLSKTALDKLKKGVISQLFKKITPDTKKKDLFR